MTDAHDPRRQGTHHRQRRKRRDAFTEEQRAAAKKRRWQRQRERRANAGLRERSQKRADERRRYHQRKGRRRRLRNVETQEREYIAGGFYVASASELENPTFVTVSEDGSKRWKPCDPTSPEPDDHTGNGHHGHQEEEPTPDT